GRKTRYEIVDAHLVQALNSLLDTTLAADESAPCIDSACDVPGCATGEGNRKWELVSWGRVVCLSPPISTTSSCSRCSSPVGPAKQGPHFGSWPGSTLVSRASSQQRFWSP